MRHLLLTFTAMLALAGCERAEPPPAEGPARIRPVPMIQHFTFDSGGSSHAEGFAAWHIVLERPGRLALEHTRNNQTVSHGSHHLTEQRAQTLWVVVERLPYQQLAEQAEASLPREPDEPEYTFTWMIDSQVRSARLPSTEAQQVPGVDELLTLFEPVITELTGIEASLR
ncbi:hypothetical protein [Mucisphaera sp.]|uniref:hypothetical protein n=1 Tax=Mucisphaera sp. TaxID=2913024 RepID=UPI003D11BF54